jgi:outer membrane cobalamin receptor
MKTRMFLSTFLALSLTAAAASAADDAPVAPPADGADNAAAVAESAEDKRSAQLDRFCPDSTASRIKRRSGKCMSPGRVYTRDDIERTGATTTGDALTKLDPSLGRGF